MVFPRGFSSEIHVMECLFNGFAGEFDGKLKKVITDSLLYLFLFTAPKTLRSNFLEVSAFYPILIGLLMMFTPF